MMTLPGEPIELVPEPGNRHDSNAIAVVSPRGVQIGYLSAERAPYIRVRMSRGDDMVAIFQGIDSGAAFIRVRFGGADPSLPPPADHSAASGQPQRSPGRSVPYDPDAFYPDNDGPEWRA